MASKIFLGILILFFDFYTKNQVFAFNSSDWIVDKKGSLYKYKVNLDTQNALEGEYRFDKFSVGAGLNFSGDNMASNPHFFFYNNNSFIYAYLKKKFIEAPFEGVFKSQLFKNSSAYVLVNQLLTAADYPKNKNLRLFFDIEWFYEHGADEGASSLAQGAFFITGFGYAYQAFFFGAGLSQTIYQITEHEILEPAIKYQYLHSKYFFLQDSSPHMPLSFISAKWDFIKNWSFELALNFRNYQGSTSQKLIGNLSWMI